MPIGVDQVLIVDAGPDATVDSGVDASVDAGPAIDSHTCQFVLETGAGRVCGSAQSLDDQLKSAFPDAGRIFLSSHHGDWSVLAEVWFSVDPNSVRYASARLDRDGGLTWLRKNVRTNGIDSDEAGNICGVAARAGEATPSYCRVDDGEIINFDIPGGCVATSEGRLFVGSLGLKTFDADGGAYRTFVPSMGLSPDARLVGVGANLQSLVSSLVIEGGAQRSFGEVFDREGVRVGPLFDPGFPLGVRPKAIALSGVAVGVGLNSLNDSVQLLWPDVTKPNVLQLPRDDSQRVDLTAVSTDGAACGIGEGQPVFWTPGGRQTVTVDTINVGMRSVCTGAHPGGRFLISSLGVDGGHSMSMVRLTTSE